MTLDEEIKGLSWGPKGKLRFNGDVVSIVQETRGWRSFELVRHEAGGESDIEWDLIEDDVDTILEETYEVYNSGHEHVGNLSSEAVYKFVNHEDFRLTQE